MSEHERGPLLRVVRGDPSEDELAALLAVLLARSRVGSAGRVARPAWAARRALLRRPLHPGQA